MWTITSCLEEVAVSGLCVPLSDVNRSLCYDVYQQNPKSKYILEMHDYQYLDEMHSVSLSNRYLDPRRDSATRE